MSRLLTGLVVHGKARFWGGLALCIAGVVVTLLAQGRPAMHLLSGGLVIAGTVIALRHARS